MEKRVRILEAQNPDDMQEAINCFLRNEAGKLHDVKFAPRGNNTDVLYALLIWTPEEPC